MEQDFVLMFGEDVSGKFLEKWTTTFKKKIIQQCRKLPSTSELEDLLLAADNLEDGIDVDDDMMTSKTFSSCHWLHSFCVFHYILLVLKGIFSHVCL